MVPPLIFVLAWYSLLNRDKTNSSSEEHLGLRVPSFAILSPWQPTVFPFGEHYCDDVLSSYYSIKTQRNPGAVLKHKRNLQPIRDHRRNPCSDKGSRTSTHIALQSFSFCSTQLHGIIDVTPWIFHDEPLLCGFDPNFKRSHVQTAC